jgi:hypothetical protein
MRKHVSSSKGTSLCVKATHSGAALPLEHAEDCKHTANNEQALAEQ